ncbi:uncharacterized protein VP01_1463g4 [Puccinia sorghi]|uniref:Uncharacterized protein n=1 Tax=Puccinia sorghi TaxID=27349 RepID=A0A0L6VLN1_9BASI|nr:uncharacterized protein VP01_1463g4 [Puccinia sorghi]
MMEKTNRTFDGGADRTNRNLDDKDKTNRNLDSEDRTNRNLDGKDKTNKTFDGKDSTWIKEELNNWEREFVSEHFYQVARKKSLDLEKELIGYKRLPIMDSNQQDQSAIIEEQRVKISEMQSSMREMKEMMAMFLQQNQSPRNIPVPELQLSNRDHQFGLQHQHHKPEEQAAWTTIWGIEDSLLDTPVPTPESSQPAL